MDEGLGRNRQQRCDAQDRSSHARDPSSEPIAVRKCPGPRLRPDLASLRPLCWLKGIGYFTRFGGWARGGIGRREGLRILWSNPCRFDPCRAHQHLTKAAWASPAPEPPEWNLSHQCWVEPHAPVTLGAVPGVLNRQFQVRDIGDVELKPVHSVVCHFFRTKQLAPVPANHEDH